MTSEIDPSTEHTHQPGKWNWEPKLKWFAAEFLVVVTGVLVALSVNAWWTARQEAHLAESQLVALTRDFEQMSGRVDQSIETASLAVRSGEMLVDGLLGPEPEAMADSALWMLGRTLWYEVFSPSTGAYESLIASGNIEILRDAELKRSLAEFFGSFDDLRVSEDALQSVQLTFFDSASYHSVVGARLIRSAFFDDARAATPATVRSWSDSSELVNGIFSLWVRQDDVLDDYRSLRKSIDDIQNRLATPSRLVAR